MNPTPSRGTGAPLMSHLLELRTRLLRMVIGLAVIFIPCATWSNELFELLSRPLLRALGDKANLVALGVMSTFTAPFTLAFYVSLAVAMPYLLWEVWGFVAPGLYRHEKRFAVPLVLSSIVLFYAGMAFAYFAVFPGIFRFLVATTPEGVKMATDISDFVSFATTLFVAFGLSFEVPVVVVLMVITGLVSAEKLGESRGYVIVAIFVLAAILTPTTDAVSQLAMAGPMWLLYEGGLVAARLVQKLRVEREATQP